MGVKKIFSFSAINLFASQQAKWAKKARPGPDGQTRVTAESKVEGNALANLNYL